MPCHAPAPPGGASLGCIQAGQGLTVRGRLWLVLGVAFGIAIAIGRVPFLAGAARSLADDSLRIVASGGSRLIAAVGRAGAPRRVILGVAAVVGVLIPGVTAWLLVLVAKGAQRLRAVVAVVLALIGVAAFAYQPGGNAIGVLVLGLAVAGAALTLSGPLLVAPLAALAGLIGAVFLPRLLHGPGAVPNAAVVELHRALLASAGSPFWLRVVVLVIAAIPFALAARAVARS